MRGLGVRVPSPASTRPARHHRRDGSMTLEGFPSGQREQTVNLSAYAFGGSNPPPSTIISIVNGLRGNSSVARASAFQAEGRGFESRFPLHLFAPPVGRRSRLRRQQAAARRKLT